MKENNKNYDHLWEVVETPKQAELLAKAIRIAKLMGSQPYYRAGEKGLYEVAPDGKSVSPLTIALLNGAPAGVVKLLLVEAERRSAEWAAKQSKDESGKDSSKDKETVV